MRNVLLLPVHFWRYRDDNRNRLLYARESEGTHPSAAFCQVAFLVLAFNRVRHLARSYLFARPPRAPWSGWIPPYLKAVKCQGGLNLPLRSHFSLITRSISCARRASSSNISLSLTELIGSPCRRPSVYFEGSAPVNLRAVSGASYPQIRIRIAKCAGVIIVASVGSHAGRPWQRHSI